MEDGVIQTVAATLTAALLKPLPAPPVGITPATAASAEVKAAVQTVELYMKVLDALRAKFPASST
jgi:hypothetical protein